MVSTLLRSSLREIRQSFGRYVAILAIVALGVGFFAGLRMSEPDMKATGVEYLDTYRLYDFRLISTLGFTEEDVDYFSKLDGVETAQGSIYTEFLYHTQTDEDEVLIAHSLTEGANEPKLLSGRMPEKANECLGDANYFTEEDIGRTIQVSDANDEDTLELMAFDEYTIVGIARSPLYLNYERGTASIGNGTISAFVLIPPEGFESEAYYEIFLMVTERADAYSEAYEARIDSLKAEMERLTEERGDLRYTTLYADAIEEIRDGEQELADGWEEYEEGLADFEQGKLDYADGVQEYEDAVTALADAEESLADGWKEYEDGKADANAELADAKAQLEEGEEAYESGLAAWQESEKELGDAEAQLNSTEEQMSEALAQLESGKSELDEAKAKLETGENEYEAGVTAWEESKNELDQAKTQLDASEEQMSEALAQLERGKAELDDAKAQLEAGEAAYQQAKTLYQAGQALTSAFAPGSSVEELLAAAEQDETLAVQLDMALQAQGSSLEAFQAGWTAAAQAMGGTLDQQTLDGFRGELDQGWQDYESGLAVYEENLAQYESGRAQLDAAWAEYNAGQEALNEGKAELDSARAELDQGWQDYESGLAAYEEKLALYESGRAQLDAAWAEVNAGQTALNEGKAELDSAKAELDQGWSDYYSGKAEMERELDKAHKKLKDGEQEIADGYEELADAKIELDDAAQEIADAEIELADAEQELLDGEQELADAYIELEDLKAPDTYTLTRNENVGYASFDNDTNIIKAISVVFPVFFFLVAALVCMTTMTRMVDEQRTQIGVLKALGYSNNQILGKYLLYSGSAAIAGSVVGYIIGSMALPWIIWEIYRIMYSFADLVFTFDPLLALLSFAAAMLCSMGVTYLSCRLELSRQSAELIRPKAPKAGKRIFLEYVTPIWKHLSFLQKVSVRNVFRYRSRLIMMLLGIGGCTALLITGFGIRDSVASIADKQYDQITVYDLGVTFEEEQTQEEAAAYLEQHDYELEEGLLVYSGTTDVVADSVTEDVHLVVSSTERLDGFISLHDGDETIAYPGDGEIVLSVGLAETMGIGVGDEIQLRDEDMRNVSVTVSGIADHYIDHYAYITPETYQQQTGHLPEYKTLYVLAHDAEDPYAESVALAEDEGVSGVSVNLTSRERVNSMLSRMDYVVVVVVVCAAALAFVVLYNLTNINISERIREIATIKVLGFYHNEVATYVFRENHILSVMGSIVGLLFGKLLHLYVMEQVKVDGIYFPIIVEPGSYGISIALTILFTVLITRFMRKKLKTIDMAESLKSIE